MKIALLISGTPRNYLFNEPTWRKYLTDLFDVDIFFHCYNVFGRQYKSEKSNIDISRNKLCDDDIKTLIDKLKPKKYIVDDYEENNKNMCDLVVEQTVNMHAPFPENILSQLYSIYACNELKKKYEEENNMTYDIVIKIRFDTIFYSEFTINDFNLIINNKNVILCGNPNIKSMWFKQACSNCINLNKYYYNKGELKKCDGHNIVSDIVFISNSKNINFYADMFNKYNEMIIEVNKNIKKENTYLFKSYDSGVNVYIGYNEHVTESYLYPEKGLAIYLKDYILLNYNVNLDTNRNF